MRVHIKESLSPKIKEFINLECLISYQIKIMSILSSNKIIDAFIIIIQWMIMLLLNLNFVIIDNYLNSNRDFKAVNKIAIINIAIKNSKHIYIIRKSSIYLFC